MRTASHGVTRAAIATMRSGKTMRIPNTAMAMPQVRKRLTHFSSMSRKTVALTTALSRLSDVSMTPKTAAIKTDDATAPRAPACKYPSRPARMSAMTVNAIEPLKCCNILFFS